jgi:cell division protein FtsA
VNGLVDVIKNPVFSTGVGLLIFGCENERHRPLRHQSGVWERMKGWFQGNF